MGRWNVKNNEGKGGWKHDISEPQHQYHKHLQNHTMHIILDYIHPWCTTSYISLAFQGWLLEYFEHLPEYFEHVVEDISRGMQNFLEVPWEVKYPLKTPHIMYQNKDIKIIYPMELIW